MPEYRRLYRAGGMYFLTLVTERRRRILCEDRARSILHDAIACMARARPCEIGAIVLLPDHLHIVIDLPNGERDFSGRVSMVKSHFTRGYLAVGGHEASVSESKLNHRQRGVWQGRFWEHLIRDQEDLNRHLDYIHYNPVKHGLAACPHAWPWSSFSRHVEKNHYASDWLCTCTERRATVPDFSMIQGE